MMKVVVVDVSKNKTSSRIMSDSEIKKRQESLDKDLKRISYSEKRQNEYPSIGDQLDAIMKWLSTETEFQIPHELKSLAMKCMSVKAKYPKPENGRKK